VTVRTTLAYAALAAVVAAAAVAATVVLLGSTKGDARIGHLSPVVQLRPAVTAPPATTQPDERHDERHENDD
jgi:hypothetical protein